MEDKKPSHKLLCYGTPVVAIALGYLLSKRLSSNSEIIGGIEMGGTNIKLCLAKRSIRDMPFKIIGEPLIIKTAGDDGLSIERDENGISPYHSKIFSKMIEFLTSQGPISNIGIASFGPICVDPESDSYGTILNSPKKKWVMFNLVKAFNSLWEGPKPSITVDTDVNAVAKFEFGHGGHNAKKNLAYITVGTGIGVGLVINGDTCTGLTHPEGGHVCVNRHSNEVEEFKSVCGFHDCCVEGYATNVSIAKRKNIDIEALPSLDDTDPVWELVAYYLASLCCTVTLTCSPEAIVIGGGVMNRKILYKMIQEEFITQMHNYITHDKITKENVDKYIVRSRFENDCGLYSALSLV
ncbi:unnamed protein product [Moneuplotes crassus]|uniref:fructokinase n=1 Tax=Euplotes crassus TaxID=5936 RepID=A0AAD1UR57_EUPCR|nr:unnamed protein product [Moneuplotes crassus]